MMYIKENGYAFKGNKSVKIVLPFYWKGVYSKRKEFSHLESRFFPLRVDPFHEEFDVEETNRKSQKLSCKTWQKI